MGFFEERYKKMDPEFELTVPGTRYIRISPLHEETVSRLMARGVQLNRSPLPGGYSYEAEFSLAATTEYLAGMFYIQGLASQTVAFTLLSTPDDATAEGNKGGLNTAAYETRSEGWTIIDMAAAPGSKTTHVAELAPKAKILALDSNPQRLVAVRENCERLGITNVLTVKKDARYVVDLNIEGGADAIMLDAPCSGNYCSENSHAGNDDEQTEARGPEAWFGKRRIEDMQANAHVQKELLAAAASALKPGGVLVYSTCSLEPEEDELVIDWALREGDRLGLVLEETGLPAALKFSPGLTSWDGNELDPSLNLTARFWPYKTGTEGFFVAKFRKK